MSAPPKKGWGSLAGNLLSNLENRLDTLLADEQQASAAQEARAAAQSKTNTSSSATTAAAASTSSNKLAANGAAPPSRDASRTRVNDRLAERLAKATALKTSRPATPANDSPRPSGESRRAEDVLGSVPDIAVQAEGSALPEVVDKSDNVPLNSEEVTGGAVVDDQPLSLAASTLPLNPARLSGDGSRPSVDLASSRPSLDAPNGTHTPSDSAADQTKEEIQAYMERIDALQAKLTYLAKETVAAAKKANAAPSSTSLEKQLAEKDEKIALLMEEGEKLSKNELKQLQTIKKLRAKTTEDDKVTVDLKKKFERAERSELELKMRLRKAESAERQAGEKMKQMAIIESQVDELRVDRENAAELIRSLTTQLKEANERAAAAEKSAVNKASEVDKRKIADLQNELEDAQIEKKLALDRAASETKKLREEAERQQERFSVRELEFKSEVSGLESRLEAMRARAEEASTTSGSNDGEGSIKLVRQVESLQQQYALAKGNWETIEGSLNARVAALERERDEAAKRETDVRKRARDAGVKSRKAEEELEGAMDKIQSLTQEIASQQKQISALQDKLEQAETAQAEARIDLDRQRNTWEAELASRLEEERLKLRKELQSSSQYGGSVQSPTASQSRKMSDITSFRGKNLSRIASHDLSTLHIDQYQRPSSAHRRSPMTLQHSTSYSARSGGNGIGTPTEASPSISRRESMMLSSFQPQSGNDMPPTPSIGIIDRLSEVGGVGNDSNSPQHTMADLVSDSTAGPGAGPSVQLVERMSSLVRKLESEKASFKDELERLKQQRDEARDEVVGLMREVESSRKQEVDGEEMSTLKKRYEASLEMLGEREEEVEELKGDVVELKRIYKELVETKVGG